MIKGSKYVVCKHDFLIFHFWFKINVGNNWNLLNSLLYFFKKSLFFYEKWDFSKSRHRTPKNGEPRPQITFFNEHSHCPITFQLNDYLVVMFKNSKTIQIQKIPPKFQKMGPQTTGQRVRQWRSRSRFSPGRCPTTIFEIWYSQSKFLDKNWQNNFSNFLQCELDYSKINIRCLPGLNRDPQWIELNYFLSPHSLSDSLPFGLWLTFLKKGGVFGQSKNH